MAKPYNIARVGNLCYHTNQALKKSIAELRKSSHVIKKIRRILTNPPPRYIINDYEGYLFYWLEQYRQGAYCIDGQGIIYCYTEWPNIFAVVFIPKTISTTLKKGSTVALDTSTRVRLVELAN